MNDNDFMRYSRQILLENVTIQGQKNLLNSRVLIIGIGGLGAPASLYLAGAGVGTLVLADGEKVHLSDLQRQIIFTTEDIAKSKAKIAVRRLAHLNPKIKLIALYERLIGYALEKAISEVNLVLDCSDNMATRQEINAACVMSNIPLITASGLGMKGQLASLIPPWTNGCYRCLWPDSEEPNHNCRTAGVLGPLVGIMGTMQALEAIKLLSKMEIPRNQLYLFDAQKGNLQKISLQKANNCPVCGG